MITSGARWPSHPLGRIAPRVQVSGRADLPPLSVFLDEGVVPRSTRDDNFNRLGENLDRYLLVQPGDIVFNKLRTWQGGLGVSRYEGIVSPAYFVCRPAPAIEPRYLHYLLRSVPYLQELTRISKWMPPSQFDIGWEQLRLLPVLAPSIEIQRAIADYLDAETARIDTLIDKKQRLMELVTESFLEVVRASVTGDMLFADPLDVSPREVTSTGWRPVKLGMDLRFGSGTTPMADDERYYDGATPWLVTGDLRDQILTSWSRTVSQKALRELSALKLHPAGALVVAMYGATVGRLGITSFPTTVNQACCVMHSGSAVSTRFLFYYLLAHRDVLMERSVGAGQPNISQDTLRSLCIPTPDWDIQAGLVHRLDERRAVVDKTTASIRAQVELMREHRQALITAAVTGDIEVSGVAA